MFDYQKFTHDIVNAMEQTLRKWAEEYDDIYILSLDCSRDMRTVGIEANTKQYLEEQSDINSEDYWYYKYCETEWTLYGTDGVIEDISAYMRTYVDENSEHFIDPDTFAFLDAFDEHCAQIIEACKEALLSVRQSINQDFPDCMLAFNIADYLDLKERAEIFALVNRKEASEEYAAHMDEFD